MVVRLNLNAQAHSAAIVRGALAGLAEHASFDAALLDDLKTAVSEVCNNAVEHAYGEKAGPLAVSIAVDPESVEVTVRDWGRGFQQIDVQADRLHVGLAVINALAERVEFVSAPDGGTEVRMSFPLAAAATRPAHAERLLDDQEVARWGHAVSGDLVVLVSPVDLLAPVLARAARPFLAGAELVGELLSDVHATVGAIASEIARSAGRPWVTASLHGRREGVRYLIGPLRPGSARPLWDVSSLGGTGRSLATVADDVFVERVGDGELLGLQLEPGERHAAPPGGSSATAERPLPDSSLSAPSTG
jgi:stage II sporulation protein AB (anti-sigma F factor)